MNRLSLSRFAFVIGFVIGMACMVSSGCGDDVSSTPDASVSTPDASPIAVDAAPLDAGTPVDAPDVDPGPPGSDMACASPPGPSNPQAPAVEIAFPPPFTLAETDEVIVRGRASHTGTVAAVRVNGIPAMSSNGFADWQATVPLVHGQNPIVIESEDDTGEVDATAAGVCVTYRVFQLDDPVDIAVAEHGDRLVILDRAAQTLYSMDLATATVTILASETVGTGMSLQGVRRGLVVDESSDSAYLNIADNLVRVALATGDRTVVSASGSLPDIFDSHALALDMSGGRILASTSSEHRVIAIDLASGDRTELSGIALGTGPIIGSAHDIELDATNGRALVVEHSAFRLMAVDLASGDRTVLSGSEVGSGPLPTGGSPLLSLDEVNNRVFVTTGTSSAVWAVELATGDRSIVSDATVGAGSPLREITALAYSANRQTLLLSDRDWKGITAIAPMSGDRSFLWYAGLGEGRPFQDQWELAIDEPGNRLYLSDYRSPEVHMVAVDLNNADRTTLWSSGSGYSYYEITGYTLGNSGDDIMWTDRELNRMVSFKPATGVLTELSSATVGAGAPFELPVDIASPHHDPARALVLDLDCGSTCRGTVISVDLSTGDRTPIGLPQAHARSMVHDAAENRALILTRAPSQEGCYPPDGRVRTVDLTAGAVDTLYGFGPNPVNETALALDTTNNRLVVAWSNGCFNSKYSYDAGIALWDLNSGQRTIIASDSVGTGPVFLTAHDVAIDSDGDYAVVGDDVKLQMVAVDLTTGQRVILSR